MCILFSCNKKELPAPPETFYTLKVNYDTKKIYACGSSLFAVQYLKDTAIFAGFGCAGERAGFNI